MYVCNVMFLFLLLFTLSITHHHYLGAVQKYIHSKNIWGVYTFMSVYVCVSVFQKHAHIQYKYECEYLDPHILHILNNSVPQR